MQFHELRRRHENSHLRSQAEAVENDNNRDLVNTLLWLQQNEMKANPEKNQVLVLGNSNHHTSIAFEERLIPISDDIK